MIKPIKLTAKKLSNLINAAIIFIILIISTFTSLFLYENFYQTITQTKKIIIIKKEAGIKTVNIKKFNIIIDKLEKKTRPNELKNIISPFR